MFHVKHPRKTTGEPDKIAARTTELVQSTLRTVGLAPGEHFWPRIERYARALALWGGTINLTAAPDDHAELAFHIVDSLGPLIVPLTIAGLAFGSSVQEAFASGRRALDLGSGGGLPGLVLAAASEAHFTMLEARRKRASFLSVTAAEMGLSNVEVDQQHRKPEELMSGFDVTTGRAFAQPAMFYRAAGAALRPGGLAILYANPDQKLDIELAGSCGLAEPNRLSYAIPRGNRETKRILAVWRKHSL
jgi:16S rRNA (guanine527-N7)-methyltransferase